MVCEKSLVEKVTLFDFVESYNTILVPLNEPSLSDRVMFSTAVDAAYDAAVRPGGVESSSDIVAVK